MHLNMTFLKALSSTKVFCGAADVSSQEAARWLRLCPTSPSGSLSNRSLMLRAAVSYIRGSVRSRAGYYRLEVLLIYSITGC